MTWRWVMRRLRSQNSYVVPGAVALAMSVAPALAQEDPEAGDTSWGQPAQPQQPAMSGGFDSSGFNNNYQTAPGAAGGGEGFGDSKPRGKTDHDAVIKKWSLGLLGLAELPVAVGDAYGNALPGGERTIISDKVLAPVIGTRYWLGKRAGIEAGVGFSVLSGSRKALGLGVNNGEGASIFGLGAHFGLPIAASYGKHYAFLLIPYLAFGYVSSVDARSNDPPQDDIFGTATVFEGGLRAGLELQLGAIGLENFALQLTTGIRLRYESRTANVPIITTEGATDTDRIAKDLRFESTAGSTLGGAVAGALAALYYF